MRVELQTHPKVVRILSAMRPQSVRSATDKFWVIGGLHAVWCVFDTHSEDGVLVGYTPEALDHVIGLPGIAAAMMEVGWLEYDGAQTLVLPEFDEHNSQSAKRRAEDQKRKKAARKSDPRPQSVRNLSANEEDISRKNCGLEKEKEKELTNAYVSGASSSVGRAARSDKGSSLPKDWQPSDDEIEFCRKERPDLSARQVADEFRDYWTAKPGKDGRKTDWQATWRNWVRRQRAGPRSAPSNFQDRNEATIAALTGRDRSYEPDDRTIDV